MNPGPRSSAKPSASARGSATKTRIKDKEPKGQALNGVQFDINVDDLVRDTLIDVQPEIDRAMRDAMAEVGTALDALETLHPMPNPRPAPMPTHDPNPHASPMPRR